MVRAVLALLLLAAPARAQDAGAPSGPPPLTVGVYAPRLLFTDSVARSKFAEQVAQQLERATGRPMRGRGFSAGDEFFAQVQAGEVDFAIVDAQVLAERSDLKPLAQGTAGGQPARPMVLVASPALKAARVGDLQGKELASVNVGGRDAQFQSNFLLQGQVDPAYFKRTKVVRDAHSALSLVQLGKADAAFTFQGSEEGLPPVFVSRPVPLPVFVQARAGLDAGVVSAVQSALAGVKVAHPTLDGFAAYGAGTHGALRTALKEELQRPGTDPVLAPPGGAPPPVPAFPTPAADLPPVLPPPAAGFVPAAPPPDEI